MKIGLGMVAFDKFTFYLKTNGKHYTYNSKIAEILNISVEELNNRLIENILKPNGNPFDFIYANGKEELVFSVDLEKIDNTIELFKKEFNKELTLYTLEKGSN